MKANSRKYTISELQRQIKSQYNEKEQLLNLENLTQIWHLILKYKEWKSIQELWLNCCQIDGMKIRNLYVLDWPNLKILYLGFNNISTNGIKLLNKINMPSLERLYIKRCKIGDEGIKSITKSDWKKLSQLYINYNRITKDGFESLNLGEWKQLVILSNWYVQPVDMMSLVTIESKQARVQFQISNYKQKIDIREIMGERFYKQK